MKIVIASDHGGFDLKELIKENLMEKGYNIEDLGTNSIEPVDYPDYGRKAAEIVARKEADKGIVVCGTGIGISISANKVKGIRCALCSDVYSAKMARAHNDSNMLALGGRVVGRDLALEIVNAWLTSEFEGGRHERRVNKIMEIEKL